MTLPHTIILAAPADLLAVLSPGTWRSMAFSFFLHMTFFLTFTIDSNISFKTISDIIVITFFLTFAIGLKYFFKTISDIIVITFF